MRKFYALLAGLFCLAGSNISARNSTPDVANFTFVVNAPNNDVVFTNTSILSTIGTTPGLRRAIWSFGDGSRAITPPLDGTQHHYQSAGTYTVCLRIFSYTPNLNDSVLTGEVCKTVVIESICRAGFETAATASTPLGRYFIAQPSHNQNKKPVRICWAFGDGRDTCIQYLTSYTGAYSVNHVYAQPGNYNVCVTIQYDAGCQAQSCHLVEIIAPDACAANFERVEIGSTVNPQTAIFRALPSHNHDKKPVRICWTFGDGSSRFGAISFSGGNRRRRGDRLRQEHVERVRRVRIAEAIDRHRQHESLGDAGAEIIALILVGIHHHVIVGAIYCADRGVV